MAKIDYTPDARVLVGIDISKHRHEVLITAPGRTRRRRMTITNTTDDFMRLIAILRVNGGVKSGHGAAQNQAIGGTERHGMRARHIGAPWAFLH